MLSNWKICFNVFNIRTYGELLCNLAKLMKLQKERPVLTSQFDVSKSKKNTLKCNADLFGPISQLWSATLKCMRASKPQRCVQQHKSLKVTHHATNRGKRINETSKQILAYNFFEISCNYTEGMISISKICFNVLNIRKYNELFCNFSKINETV